MASSLLSNGYVSVRAPTELLSQAARPLSIKRGNVEISILIPGALWATAEHLREQFLLSLAGEAPPSEQTDELTELELSARLLKFGVQQAAKSLSEAAAAFMEVVRLVFSYIHQRFLKGNDIHVVADAQLPSEAAVKTVINAYLVALTALQDTSLAAQPSALFVASQEERARLFAIFGGQGTSVDFFNETHDLF
ncbi:hypothetical protein BJ085DRAFT_22582, partial [Dimargaris cristalligena]